MAFDGFLQSSDTISVPSISASLLGRQPPRLREPTRTPIAARDEALHRETAILVHDLNNLLGAILNANELLAERLPAGSEQAELAEISQHAAQRSAELLRRLLDLSAPKASADCDARKAVQATLQLAALSIPTGVVIASKITEADLRCAADRGALEQALLNLCVNAGHAMPAGGALTVSATTEGGDVVLSVRDTGCGMSPATLARATEAYFTTRQGRGGTGLGLSGVQDFARRSGGRLELSSEEGRGTTATLRLPRAG